MIALDPRASTSYVVEEDRELPAEQRTTFQLAVLAKAERSAIDGWRDDKLCSPTEFAYRVLGVGLRGWSNLRLPDGSQVEYRSETASLPGLPHASVVPPEVLEHIPARVWGELCRAVDKGNQLTDTDRGN
jgi:hypothetical protein